MGKMRSKTVSLRTGKNSSKTDVPTFYYYNFFTVSFQRRLAYLQTPKTTCSKIMTFAVNLKEIGLPADPEDDMLKDNDLRH
jgi:hypothetical protein